MMKNGLKENKYHKEKLKFDLTTTNQMEFFIIFIYFNLKIAEKKTSIIVE